MKNKMKYSKIFATLIILAFMISIVPITQVKAQTAVTTLKTYPVCDAVPDPVGLGQDVLVKFGILQQAGAVEQGWTGVTVTVVKPDNTTETLGPFKTDSTGSSFTLYTPDQVGTYYLTTNFPEQTNPVGYFNYEANVFSRRHYHGSKHCNCNHLNVQQEPLRFIQDMLFQQNTGPTNRPPA